MHYYPAMTPAVFWSLKLDEFEVLKTAVDRAAADAKRT